MAQPVARGEQEVYIEQQKSGQHKSIELDRASKNRRRKRESGIAKRRRRREKSGKRGTKEKRATAAERGKREEQACP